MNERYTIYLPVNIDVHDDGSCMITGDGNNCYGMGATMAEAVADYLSMLAESYFHLCQDETILADHLKAELQSLRLLLGGEQERLRQR